MFAKFCPQDQQWHLRICCVHSLVSDNVQVAVTISHLDTFDVQSGVLFKRGKKKKSLNPCVCAPCFTQHGNYTAIAIDCVRAPPTLKVGWRFLSFHKAAKTVTIEGYKCPAFHTHLLYCELQTNILDSSEGWGLKPQHHQVATVGGPLRKALTVLLEQTRLSRRTCALTPASYKAGIRAQVHHDTVLLEQTRLRVLLRGPNSGSLDRWKELLTSKGCCFFW